MSNLFGIKFNATNNYYDLQDDDEWDITLSDGSQCYAFWLDIDSNSGSFFQYIFSNTVSSNDDGSIGFLTRESGVSSPNTYAIRPQDITDEIVSGAQTFPSGRVFAVLQYNHTSTRWEISICKEGQSNQRYVGASGVSNDVFSTFWQIGQRGDGDADRKYSGVIYSVLKFNTMLLDADIESLAESYFNFDPTAYSPSIYYPMNEGEGSSITDTELALSGTGFGSPEWHLYRNTVLTSSSAITWSMIQGFTRDESNFYGFDSAFSGGHVNGLYKFDLSNNLITSNTDPFIGMPDASNLKFSDGCTKGGIIYNPVHDSGAPQVVYFAKYNASDLSRVSYVDISSLDLGVRSGGFGFAANGNILLVGFYRVENEPLAKKIYELDLDGALVATHALETYIYGMQGITYDSDRGVYYIASADEIRNLELIYTLDENFNILNIEDPDVLTLEMEGLEYYGNQLLISEISNPPVIMALPELVFESILTVENTGIPDDTYSFDFYNDDTKTLIDTRDITFTNGGALVTGPVDVGTNVFIFSKGTNPPTTGMAYDGVTE